MTKFLDSEGLLYFWGKLKAKFNAKADKATTLAGYGITDAGITNGTITLGANSITPLTAHQDISGKVDKEQGKGLSAEDFTAALKSKLDGIDTGAEVNVIETINVNATALTIASKTADIPNASTSAYGCTKLSNATNSTSQVLAATPKAVKTAYDLADSKQSPATTLAGYGITDAYTKTEIDAKLTSAMRYKGSVAAVANLPASNNEVGDFYNVTATGDNYAWTGSEWDFVGNGVQVQNISNAEIDTVLAT